MTHGVVDVVPWSQQASLLGEKLWISDPQGTFDESRLHLAEKIVMIAAGSGK